MQIRNLQEIDLPELIEFVKNCEELTLERDSIFWLFWRFFQNTCFIAKKDNQVIGILLGFLDQREGKAGFIHELGVTAEFRKQGVGSKLIKKFLEAIKNLGGNKIILTTFPTNHGAIEFYEKSGFINNGTVMKINQERIEFFKEII